MAEIVLSGIDMYKSRKGKILLDGYTLELRRGKFYGLIGSEKSGKSAVLRALLGLIRLDSGEVTWSMPRMSVGAQVGLPAFHRELSIRDNMRAQASMLRPSPPDKRIDELMDRLKIKERFAGSRTMRHLLVGQKQLAAIAMAMVGRPDLLILDEPMQALDIADRSEFADIIRDEYNERTVLFTATTEEELQDVVTEFIYIQEGRNA